MGEHGTWFDFLNRFSWWQSLQEKADHALGRKWQCGTTQLDYMMPQRFDLKYGWLIVGCSRAGKR